MRIPARYLEILPAIGALLLACVLGYLLGRITTLKFSLPENSIILREDVRPVVPVVQITAVKNGEVVGSITGEARFFLGTHIVIPDASGAFRVPANPLLTNMVTVTVPEGMKFVASKNGKKYYPVGSSSASQIAPINRVYFRTAAEAERAGYSK